MYSKCEAFQINQQKTEEKQRKLVKIHFHFSALIACAMSLQRALKIFSSVHPWANSRLLVVSLFSKGPTSGFTSRAEEAIEARRTRRQAKQEVWMKGTWGETRKDRLRTLLEILRISFQSPSLQEREKLIGLLTTV